MSLVPVWVRATNELWYRNPIFRGEGWFICFDDDDPPEIVVAGIDREQCLDKAVQVLAELKIKYKQLRWVGRGGRIFGKPREAHYFFFELLSRIPPPADYGGPGRATLPKEACVYYDPPK